MNVIYSAHQFEAPQVGFFFILLIFVQHKAFNADCLQLQRQECLFFYDLYLDKQRRIIERRKKN